MVRGGFVQAPHLQVTAAAYFALVGRARCVAISFIGLLRTGLDTMAAEALAGVISSLASPIGVTYTVYSTPL